MENEIETSIKDSPNYEQQLEEIEILQNILLEKVKIIKEEPNFHIQIEIEGDNPNQEESFKTFYLEVQLNNDYPEKPPKLKIFEANDNLSDKNKEIIMKKMEEYCQDNIGMPMIYQLYEIMKEFADEEEKISIKEEKKEKDKISGKFTYELNSLQKIKQIKLKDSYPIDIYIIKNGNILVIYNNGLIKIYDNKFENVLFELIRSDTDTSIISTKFFDFSSDYCSLYLIDIKNIFLYKISFLPKKSIIDNPNYKINGDIKVDFVYKFEANDVIELPQYKDTFFVIKEDEIEGLLYEYSKQNFNYKNISKNEFEKPFRKLHYINSDKFLMASYTLKEKENKITGMNKMCILDIINFQIKKSYDIKISPIKNCIDTYKNKYLIFSYFTTIEAEQGNDEEENEDRYYSFDDNYYNEVFHNLEKKINDYDYYDDDDYYYYDDNYGYRYVKYYDDYENKYYSYDIKQHYIGIYSIEYEEFIRVTLPKEQLFTDINLKNEKAFKKVGFYLGSDTNDKLCGIIGLEQDNIICQRIYNIVKDCKSKKYINNRKFMLKYGNTINEGLFIIGSEFKDVIDNYDESQTFNIKSTNRVRVYRFGFEMTKAIIGESNETIDNNIIAEINNDLSFIIVGTQYLTAFNSSFFKEYIEKKICIINIYDNDPSLILSEKYSTIECNKEKFGENDLKNFLIFIFMLLITMKKKNYFLIIQIYSLKQNINIFLI